MAKANLKPSATSRAVPPLWYVQSTNAVVGPMTTATFLRGISYGHVPHNSLVRGSSWDGWRELRTIREYQALRRIKDRNGEDWHPPYGWVPPSASAETAAIAGRSLSIAQTGLELLLIGLNMSVEMTLAQYGAAYRWDVEGQVMRTMFVLGPHILELEGTPLEPQDPSSVAARAGRGVVGSRGVGEAQRAIVDRLKRPATPLHGVAMVPLVFQQQTWAMLELAREDHAFRACDKTRLEGVREAIEHRFAGIARLAHIA